MFLQHQGLPIFLETKGKTKGKQRENKGENKGKNKGENKGENKGKIGDPVRRSLWELEKGV